jgi:DNA-binding NarL/FixJ family response regulator
MWMTCAMAGHGTTYGTDADILRAIDAGAVGYLLKDAPHQEIARAVQAAARGETTLAPAIAQRLMQHVRSPAGDALSAREIEVLQLAARGAPSAGCDWPWPAGQATTWKQTAAVTPVRT